MLVSWVCQKAGRLNITYILVSQSQFRVLAFRYGISSLCVTLPVRPLYLLTDININGLRTPLKAMTLRLIHIK